MDQDLLAKLYEESQLSDEMAKIQYEANKKLLADNAGIDLLYKQVENSGVYDDAAINAVFPNIVDISPEEQKMGILQMLELQHQNALRKDPNYNRY